MNKLVMFDLDGTLIDSVGGIVNSVNETRKKYGYAPLPAEKVASYTGDGARILLERCFAGEELPCPMNDLVKNMVDIYAAAPLVNTHLYPDVKESLDALKKAGYLLAVISNKPQQVSEKILAGLEIRQFFCENIGGGSFPLKPAPDALLYLMGKYNIPKENAWMVGDNHTDINAAAAAGICSIFCRFGFGLQADTVPNYMINSFAELLSLLI